MRFRAFSVATILALGIFTLAAHADTVTYQISFSTSPTTSFPFLDPSSGSFTLVLDPTQTYENATAGLTVNSLVFDPFISESASVPAGFDYDPSTGDLIIGGGYPDQIGTVSSGVPSWELQIDSFPTDPTFAELGASAPQAGDVAFYETGTVNVSPSTSPVPEPSSLLLLGSGLISAVGVARRRRGSN